MRPKYKIVKIGPEVREKLKRGIDIVADIIKMTLGNYGRNAMIEIKRRAPQITNDGFTIARHIVLKDEIEDLGAQAIIETAVKTNDMVGDGTTTAVVLAQAIINEVMKEMEEKHAIIKPNVIQLYNEINEWCQKVCDELDKMAKPIKTHADLEKVAIVSVQNEKLGKIIAEMIQKVGVNGFISVEEGFKYETEYEVVSGMQFHAKYAAPFMVTRLDRKEAIYEGFPVLITNHEIDTAFDLLRNPRTKEGIFNDLLENKQSGLIIIAPKFGKSILFTFYDAMRKGFKILGVKAPALTSEQLEDIAVYTGATFCNKDKGMELTDITLDDLGYIKKIIVNQDKAAIIGETKFKKEVNQRIKDLKEQLNLEKTEMFKKKLERRIASLAGGIGVIRVGAKTEVERGYLKLKIEDAVSAAKAALESGVVPGGGLALKKIAEKLPKNILTEALKAPYKQIQENAGGKLKIGKDIVDPVKVTKVALQNACSLAGIFITTEAVICWDKQRDIEQLREILGFRPDEEYD